MLSTIRLMTGLLLFAAFAPWQANAAKGDVQAGEQRAQACSGCHGAKGVSAMPGVPSLAGQQDSFLQWQLVFFRSGRRDNPIMTSLAQGLSDEDVRNLGAYFATLTPPGAGSTPAADHADASLIDAGKALAEQHHCAACHTDTFAGKQAAARIADQRADYLEHALADYRSAARPSTGVAAMNEAAAGLSDPDIKALAAYLANLQ